MLVTQLCNTVDTTVKANGVNMLRCHMKHTVNAQEISNI